MHKVILDTDPGVDDAMAIAYALAAPDVELLGLTTVFGNVSLEQTTRNARYVLDLMGAVDVDVAAGAARPLIQTPLPHAEFVHGDDGIGNCHAPLPDSIQRGVIDARDAADYIIEQAWRHQGEITLVAVGPLTNIAMALAREPSLPTLVRELVIMGGTVEEPGNVSPVAEANFLNDPHAADQVLAADWPAVVVGLDVTHRIMLCDSQLAELRDGAGRTGDFLWRSSRFYVDFYMSRGAAQGQAEPCCAMHDAAAIARLLLPDAFTEVTGGCRVVADGIAVGQLTVDRTGRDYTLTHWRDRPRNTAVSMAVDAERVRRHFIDTVLAHHLV